jgi:hypothetical protein
VAKHESFLVRVWWRARSGEGQWVGRLEHLQERAVQNFHDPEELLAHLRTVLMPLEGAEPVDGESPYSVFESLDDVKKIGVGDPAAILVSPKASPKGQEVRTPSHPEMVRTTQ